LWTNPVALRATVDEAGVNLMRGAFNALDDIVRASSRLPPPGAERFIVGRDVAITPGRVVFRNRLIELLQYEPATPQVHPEPVLLVPAWIMKYYILDLSPGNSLIKYLVDRGHTVFCLSWKNPTSEEHDLGIEDYLQLGLFSALEAVAKIVPERKVHALGYCLGGTLLAIGAAAMARDRDERLGSITLLAAQTEFSEPGELGLFIDESQVNLLEAQVARSGYLAAEQMAGAFQLLRSYDLIWSQLINRYLLGQSVEMSDLMAWNADTTRMPARMHSEYLRHFFLHDDLAEQRYRVGGRPVSLSDIKVPVFLVGTVTDHVAPWRSVYKLHYLTSSEVTFVLTSGGHNAGIVSPPDHPRRHYQLLQSMAGEARLDPDTWLVTAPDTQGSWWPAWHEWLRARSAPPIDPPPMGIGGRPLSAAPGHYVMER
jgi:polyhydroxyalkanoate synthase